GFFVRSRLWRLGQRASAREPHKDHADETGTDRHCTSIVVTGLIEGGNATASARSGQCGGVTLNRRDLRRMMSPLRAPQLPASLLVVDDNEMNREMLSRRLQRR